MVTLAKRGNSYNVPLLELYGFSTDEKPIENFNGNGIPNGSIFLEMDTLKVFFYNSETKSWINK